MKGPRDRKRILFRHVAYAGRHGIFVKIVSSYPLDPAYGGTSIQRGLQVNDKDGLYYLGDKVCIP